MLKRPDRATFVDVNRTRLRLWQWGDAADPVIVMVHGAFDHGRMFDGIAPRLAALGYHVVAVDMRGHGDSGRLWSGNTWLAMNLDLGLLARELGSPVRFVSHSFGGGQALCTAAIFPEDVKWVVSIDGLGPPAAAFELHDPIEATTSAFEAIQRVWDRGPRQYPSREDMAERRRKINVRMSEEWAAHLVLHGSRPGRDGGFEWKFDPMFNIGLGGPFSAEMLLAEYHLVQCPVLVVTGTEPDTWNDL
ncbi:MAG TPA: alpha/beta hydrolase, partial [Acidimicrobiales bacterium]|nr:alpha/beta hydrolase [Acidimicrobiales bacterium]